MLNMDTFIEKMLSFTHLRVDIDKWSWTKLDIQLFSFLYCNQSKYVCFFNQETILLLFKLGFCMT